MPAKSKAQQAFMGMVKKAQETGQASSPAIAKAAKSMSKKSVTDFASTPTHNLPKHAVMNNLKSRLAKKRK